MRVVIEKTETEVRDGIKYTTHYVDRSIKQGDPQGGPVGVCVNGVSKTTEIINYVYKAKPEFGRIGELMLEYLKKNNPSDMKIISISNLELKWGDDYIGRSGEHYTVDLNVEIPHTRSSTHSYYDTEIKRCYVKKSAFQEFADTKNNIIWE